MSNIFWETAKLVLALADLMVVKVVTGILAVYNTVKVLLKPTFWILRQIKRARTTNKHKEKRLTEMPRCLEEVSGDFVEKSKEIVKNLEAQGATDFEINCKLLLPPVIFVKDLLFAIKEDVKQDLKNKKRRRKPKKR